MGHFSVKISAPNGSDLGGKSTIGGRIPLGVTIFEATPEEQMDSVEHAAKAGADWVILQAPGTAVDEASLAAGFAKVLERSPLPAALQNMPQFLGVGLSVATITGLAQAHPKLIGVKQEVSATETAELVASVGSRLQVLSGRGGVELVDCMRAGISGNIPAPEYADYLVDVWRLMEAGGEAAAREAYARFLPLATFVLQSLESLTTYGKLLFCLRHDLPFHPRAGAKRPTPFGIATLAAHAQYLGIKTADWDRIMAALSSEGTD